MSRSWSWADILQAKQVKAQEIGFKAPENTEFENKEGEMSMEDTLAAIKDAGKNNNIIGLKRHLASMKDTSFLSTVESPLFEIAQSGSYECLEFLLQYSPNVNVKNASEETPLMLACRNNNIDCIRILLEYDADFRILDRTGCNAFFMTGSTEARELMRNFICSKQVYVLK
jgi:ankyrin repeat protein